MPHLLLQPLVENAIIHGLENRPEGGELTISARVAGDCLILTVEDDGVGVDMHSLKEHVGLTNTRLRLRQFSGDDYRFSLAARAARRTSVTIVVPAVVAEEVSSVATAGDLETDADAVVTEPPRARRGSRLACKRSPDGRRSQCYGRSLVPRSSTSVTCQSFGGRRSRAASSTR